MITINKIFYRKKHLHRATIFFSIILFLLCYSEIEGKSRAVRDRSPGSNDPSVVNAEYIHSLENRIRPFLENRIKRPTRSSGTSLKPSDSLYEFDFMMLARVWSRLTPEFRSLYKQAARIPTSFLKYESPGGHFEVYYTLGGTDGVDSTDNYGYSPGDWSNRIENLNGIPDYIDEVAWALDSSRSLLVDRFGFVAPIPYRDASHQSEKYKVVVEQQDPTYYGLTFVDDNGTSKRGFPSFITLRNEWSGSGWRELGYEDHPEYGARVTCAHELFHAVQYAMSWNVEGSIFLDDFPLSCIEGSAVSIEDLAFSHINDYIQYANLYYFNPQISLLSQSINDLVYTNSLLFLYLYKFATGSPGIDFLSTLFQNNYQQVTPFHENIRSTSLSLGKTWAELMNSFHSGSFFSGNRADTSRFLSDAALLYQWNYREAPDISNNVQKSVNPYAMQTFYLAPQDEHTDTLTIFTGSTSIQSVTYPDEAWAATVILRKKSGDSISPLSLNSQGSGSMIIPGWKSYDEMIIVVTNGHPSLILDYTVSFQFCPVTYFSGSENTISIAASDSQSFASVFLDTKTDLRCPLEIAPLTSQLLLDSARNNSLKPLSALFQLSYPLFWNSESTTKDSLSISLSLGMLNNNAYGYDSVNVFKWDQSLSAWKRTASVIDSGDTIIMKFQVDDPGIFGIFAPIAISSAGKITVFPNPVSQSNHKFIRFEGSNISEIRIYSNNGALVYRSFSEDPWDLKNNNDREVMPGLYTAVIFYQNESAYRPVSVRRKIMVVP